MKENEKTTVPIPSVGADGEQSLSYVTETIIPTGNEEINLSEENMELSEENMEEVLRQMQRMNDPAYLHTVSMNELYETVYQSRPPVIDGLLYYGTYLFAGAPKVGKSFFMAQLAYHVSTGRKLWNYDVHQGTVLYLALEDDYQRLQERMSRMFGVEGTDSLHFAVYAKQLGAGLDEQLEKFIQEHPDTRLIIIDTLETMDENILQVDHRVPYEIGGEQDEEDLDCFMLLSPSANRAKSWTCEHCANWDTKDAEFCLSCFWAHPENYNHVAGRLEKVVSIIFSGNEIDDYNKLIELAGEETAQETIKRIIHERLK